MKYNTKLLRETIKYLFNCHKSRICMSHIPGENEILSQSWGNIVHLGVILGYWIGYIAPRFT